MSAARDLVIVRMDRCTALLREARTIKDAQRVGALADAARVYAKRVNAGIDVTNSATALRVKAERKLGEILSEKHGKSDPRGQHSKVAKKEILPTAADLGLAKSPKEAQKIATRCRALAKLAENAIDKAADVATAAREEVSPNKLVSSLMETGRRAKRKASWIDAEIHENIIVGDFRAVADRIPDGSIHLIFTDPPYDREASKMLPALAAFAATKLVEGGSLLCYVGETQLPAALDAFRVSLRYWWIIACLHAGHSTVMREYGINASWKPILWFVKGTRHDNSIMVRDTVSGGEEKTEHPWQQAQAEAEYLIGQLCPVDGIVLDPFLGSGTTAAAAKKLGRRWLGIEIDEDTAKRASERIGA